MNLNKIYSKIDEIPSGITVGDVQQGCLLLEGGGFKSLYGQGVLDALLLNNINIHTVVGCSAGAISALGYIAGQIGRTARINLAHRHDSRFVGMQALKLSKSLINVRLAITPNDIVEAVDLDKINQMDRRLVSIVTNCLTGKTEYLDKDNCKDFASAIQASASLPYISPVVDVDGTPYLDGGCSCYLAYQWALEQGYEKIVVLRTKEKEFRKKVRELPLIDMIYKKYPNFAKAAKVKDAIYNQQCDAVDQLEKEGKAFVIAPSKPIKATTFEGDMELLGDIYWMGYQDGFNIVDQLKSYLKGTV